MNKRTRFYTTCGIVISSAMGSLLLVAHIQEWKASSFDAVCPKCGCIRHVKMKWGMRVRDDIHENDLSEWLSGFRAKTCSHVWMPVSGWSSHNNLHWDGECHWNSCLHHIRGLHPVVGEAETVELLDRYYRIFGMEDGPDKNDTFEEFREELKARVDQIDKSR